MCVTCSRAPDLCLEVGLELRLEQLLPREALHPLRVARALRLLLVRAPLRRNKDVTAAQTVVHTEDDGSPSLTCRSCCMFSFSSCNSRRFLSSTAFRCACVTAARHGITAQLVLKGN